MKRANKHFSPLCFCFVQGHVKISVGCFVLQFIPSIRTEFMYMLPSVVVYSKLRHDSL